jgi:long-chain acyl-CoA synthetase
LKKGIGTYVYDLDGPAADIEKAHENDLAAILLTSGTTGVPKGVMLTHKNFVSDCFLAQANLTLYPTDVFYALLPIHHSYTMLAVFIESLSVGAELVFGKKMVTKAILKDLKEAKVTMFLGVPMLFNKVLAGIMRGVKEKGPIVYGLIRGMMSLSGFIKKTFKVNPGKKMFLSVLDKASFRPSDLHLGGGPSRVERVQTVQPAGNRFHPGLRPDGDRAHPHAESVEHYKETSVGKIIPRCRSRSRIPTSGGSARSS